MSDALPRWAQFIEGMRGGIDAWPRNHVETLGNSQEVSTLTSRLPCRV
jgi:hypothetical protein